jgi:ketosteroid isomerase-like protein
MNDEKIASIMRDLIKSLENGDVEKTLSLFAEDGVMVNPNGTFKAKDEMRRYLTNSSQSMRDVTVTETGNKIIVQGNKAFYEHVIAATIEGKRAEGLAMCAYEFTDDKIQEVRTVYDRLLMVKQAAKGGFAKALVNLIVRQAEKGLH